MIKGQHVVQNINTNLFAQPSFLSSTCFACLRSTYLIPSFPRIVHTSAVHTSRYIDFQITKLKKYAQDGTPISWNGYGSIFSVCCILIFVIRIGALLAKPHVTVHQAKELLQLAKDINCINTNLYNDYLGTSHSLRSSQIPSNKKKKKQEH
jgi:hypothetical protein